MYVAPNANFDKVTRESLQCTGDESNVVECSSEHFVCPSGWRYSCDSARYGMLGLHCGGEFKVLTFILQLK